MNSLHWIILSLSSMVISLAELLYIGDLYSGQEKKWNPVYRDTSGPQPYPRKSESWSNRDTTIWIGIAAYRDPRCGQTLVNLFKKAAHPNRIHVGVVQQMIKGDLDCLDEFCRILTQDGKPNCPFKENVRILRTDAAESAGPMWGRHLQQYMLRDEEFCMQIDSHMDFVQDWDTHLMREWAQTNNEHAILSTYAQDVASMEKNINGHHEMSHLCEILWRTQIRNCGAKALRLMSEPKLTTTWAAGFSYSKCHAIRQVPYDPYLPQIFDGEEFSMYARFFTHGYDVYTPTKSRVGHDYNGKNNPNAHGWYVTEVRNRQKEEALSNRRLWTLLEMPGGYDTPEEKAAVQYGPFGLGSARTLDQLMDFAGINLHTKEYLGHPASKCGTVRYVKCSGTNPELSGYPDNMAYGPYWEKVRKLLKSEGKWFETDELNYISSLENRNAMLLYSKKATSNYFVYQPVFVCMVLLTILATFLVRYEMRNQGLLPIFRGSSTEKSV